MIEDPCINRVAETLRRGGLKPATEAERLATLVVDDLDVAKRRDLTIVVDTTRGKQNTNGGADA